MKQMLLLVASALLVVGTAIPVWAQEMASRQSDRRNYEVYTIDGTEGEVVDADLSGAFFTNTRVGSGNSNSAYNTYTVTQAGELSFTLLANSLGALRNRGQYENGLTTPDAAGTEFGYLVSGEEGLQYFDLSEQLGQATQQLLGGETAQVAVGTFGVGQVITFVNGPSGNAYAFEAISGSAAPNNNGGNVQGYNEEYGVDLYHRMEFGASSYDGTLDLAFSTRTSGQPLPGPIVVLLVGAIAIAGFLFFRRRQPVAA